MTTYTDVDHCYVFVRKPFGLCYERTSDEDGARRRVEELRAQGQDATYLKNELPRERWFY
jgi:hypothetical protein